jgi:hypothetical protein
MILIVRNGVFEEVETVVIREKQEQGFRIATPQEANRYYAAKRQENALREQGDINGRK